MLSSEIKPPIGDGPRDGHRMASFHQGGLGAVVDALVKAVEAHGGEICTKLRVDQVGLPWAIRNPMVLLGVTLWKSMKIIILKKKIDENHRSWRKINEHHYFEEEHPWKSSLQKKPMNIIILKRKIYETHHSKNINEHHHFEEENPWKSLFFF